MTIEREQPLNEYVGYVWFSDDPSIDREGVLVMATGPLEAKEAIQELFGPTVRVSVWNEADAARLRS